MVLHRILWSDILRLLCYFFCGQWRLRCVFLRFGGLSAKSFSQSCQSTGTHCSDGMVVPEHLSLLAEGGNKLDDFHSFEKRLLVELGGGCEQQHKANPDSKPSPGVRRGGCGGV